MDRKKPDSFDFSELDLSNVEPMTEMLPDPSDFDGTIEKVWHHVPLERGKLKPTDEINDIVRRADKFLRGSHSASDVSDIPAASHLVKGWLPRRSVSAIYGPSGVGKSSLALSIAHAVSTGQTWAKCEVRKGTVVYLVAEGAAGFRSRLFALGEERSDNLVSMYESCDFFQAKDVEGLFTAISARTNGMPPVELVVIDTLACCLGRADENKASDMARVFQSIKWLQRKLDATVLLVHHSGKSADHGMRGSSSIFASLDAVIRVTGRSKSVKSVQLEKSRDGREGAKATFQLEEVEVGKDDYGEPTGACRVKFISKLTPDQVSALDALKRFVKDFGSETEINGEDGKVEFCQTVDLKEAIDSVAKSLNTGGVRNFRQRIVERTQALERARLVVVDGSRLRIGKDD